MVDSNEKIAQSINDTPDAENVTKAIRRGLSVAQILDRERDGWLQRHRGVVVKKQSHLGHPHIHKTFDRYFEKISQYLFFIPVLGRVLVAEANHKDVMIVENAVIKAMEDAIKVFDERIGQYQAAIKAHDIDVGSFNKSYAIEITHASPLDRLYFQVLEKADLCMMLTYNLWIENALNPDYQKNEAHRTENEWEVKTLIKDVNFKIISNYRRVLNSANRDQRFTHATAPAGAAAPVAPVAAPDNVANINSASPAKKSKAKASPATADVAAVA